MLHDIRQCTELHTISYLLTLLTNIFPFALLHVHQEFIKTVHIQQILQRVTSGASPEQGMQSVDYSQLLVDDMYCNIWWPQPLEWNMN